MDDGGITASTILYIGLLLIDIFFYGFGAAVELLNEKEVERKAQEEGDKKSVRLARIIADPTEYVNTVQLITTLINIVIGSVHLGILLRLIGKGLSYLQEQFHAELVSTGLILAIAAILSTFILLYITLTIGVLIPKKIASRMPLKWAYACINPVYFVTVFLSPFTGIVSFSGRILLKLFGMSDKEDDLDVTEEEIINMVNEGHEQGIIQAAEAQMISNIFEFGDKEAQDIMTNRNHLVAIESGMTLREAIDFMVGEKYSRYPVYHENMDHILGILYVKDAMRYQTEENKLDVSVSEIQGLIRAPFFVPKTKKIDELFRQMQADKLQMSIVVDEYGQTEGLVAMEDILEEIVGNILDEYDEDSEYLEKTGEDVYITPGITPLEELEDRFGIEFDSEGFETLNGFLISKLDRIPEPDEQFDVDYKGYNFKILQVENKVISSVKITKLIAETESDDKSEESTLEENERK